MLGIPSAYVHSNQDNNELSVSVDMIDDIRGFNNGKGITYVKSTINKLNIIAQQLDEAANEFLQGYSIEEATSIANNAENTLARLASMVLNGEHAYDMAHTLARNQNVNVQKLLSKLDQETDWQNKIIKQLEGQKEMSISSLATIFIKALTDGHATITVTEGESYIRALGGLFDVKTINSSFRKQMEVDLNTKIFHSSKKLVTGKNGAFRKMIIDLVRTSKYSTVQSKGSAIHYFCERLGKEMLVLAKEDIRFVWDSQVVLEKAINEFTKKLKVLLNEKLDAQKMINMSNVIGAIGEEVRESVTRAADATIIAIQVGDLSEDKLVNDIQATLKELGAQSNLIKMNSYHTENKMSQTDLVLVNTQNGKIARAQSKNHFVSYFTKNEGNDEGLIENFRWVVEDAVNLLDFIKRLSKTNIGVGVSLNEFDLNNVAAAIANNVWAKRKKSIYSMGKSHIITKEANAVDFQSELEGSLEKLLAGQVVNLLGITLQTNTQNIQITNDASNIFYLLNGTLKRTSDLVREAIEQIENNNIKELSSDRTRLVNVNLTGLSAPNKDARAFLIEKLEEGYYAYSKSTHEEHWSASPETIAIGREMGEEIINNILVKVSLGTSIESLRKSAMVF